MFAGMVPTSRAVAVFLGAVLTAFAAMLGSYGSAFAQTPSPLSAPLRQVLPNDKRLLRWQYFHAERAYPFDRVPPGAYQRGMADYAAKFGALPGAAQVPAIDITGWSSVGPAPIATNPTTSGRINTIAVHPTDGNTIYLGAATGGVWKTTNGGSSWTPLTDSQCSLAMGSVVIDPVNPEIIYAGTGEQNFSGDSFYGCGVLRSSDGGSTWTQQGASIFDTTTGGATISRMLIDPATAGSLTTTRVFAATSFGLYRSLNSGSTWTQVLASTPVTDLVVDPSNSSILYASVGNIFGSVNNGVYKSINGGTSWTKLAGGFPTASVGRINIAVASPGILFAAVQNTTNFALLGIWKSTDSGVSWSQISATGASCASQCWYNLHMYVSPANSNIVFFGGLSLHRSTDGGLTFQDVGAANNVHVDHHGFAFQPGNPNVAYSGNDGGIWRTSDGGVTWTSLNTNLAITQFYAGASLHPTDGNIGMGGTQDNGTLLASGSLAWSLVLGGDGGYTAIDFATPTTRYAETQWIVGAGYIGPRRSDANGPFNQKLTGITLSDRAEFIPPLVMSPTISTRLYFGTYRIYRTSDRGEIWSAISPDLTAGSGTITAIAESKSNSQVVYVGTSDARVQVTTNGGTNWTLVTTGLPNRFIKSIAIHPTDPNTAFAVVSGFGTGHVFKTVNGGASWSNISSNLPDVPVNAILLDPGEPVNSIYIGTDLGVFRTTTGGTSWAPFGTGLPNTAIFDLVYNPTTNVMVAATHGRGAFRGNPQMTGPTQVVTPNTDYSPFGFQGGPFSPASIVYAVQNTGTSTLNWSAGSDQTWTTVSPTSGTVAPGGSTNVTVSINSGANTFAPNVYNATVTFTNTTNGRGNTTRAVALSVNPPRTICTQEAKLCPNGTYVGRTGPNCAFAACPGGDPEIKETDQSKPAVPSTLAPGIATSPDLGRSPSASVEVRREGPAILVVASNAKVSEVLDKLSNSFDFRYDSQTSLDALVSGRFSGTLEEVAMRVLEGLQYEIKRAGSAVEVNVGRR